MSSLKNYVKGYIETTPEPLTLDQIVGYAVKIAITSQYHQTSTLRRKP